jgi:hypothetical protein
MAENKSIAATHELILECDSTPLLCFVNALNQILDGALGFGDLDFELFRIESDLVSASGTNELSVTLYPSDVLLRFAATVWTRNRDVGAIENGHVKPQMVKKSIEITEEMIRAGVRELIEYEVGGISASEMVSRVFVSMLLASSLCPALEPKVHAPEQQSS